VFDKIDIKDRKEKFQSLEKEAKQVPIIEVSFLQFIVSFS